MNNYREGFDFEKQGNKIKQCISIITIMLLFVLGTIIIQNCANIFIQDEKIETIQTSKKDLYDINKPFKELNITTQKELNDYLHWLVDNYLEPKELVNLINWNDSYYRLKGWNWNGYKDGWILLKQNFVWKTYNELITRVVEKGYDWSILPLTKKFRKKFNGIDIPTYYNLDIKKITTYFENGESNISLDIAENDNMFYINYHTGNGMEEDQIVFKYYFNENGYLDDIVLQEIVPMYYPDGSYKTKKDRYLMNKDYSIETILYHILANEEYYDLSYNIPIEWDPGSHPNKLAEIGMTDRFRLYFESLKGNGILPDKIFRTLYKDIADRLIIENIDIDNKTAMAKVILVEKRKVKYYNLYWTTDGEYRLDSIDIKLNREIEVPQNEDIYNYEK